MEIYRILAQVIIAAGCLLYAASSFAQSPNVYTYSTIDFDDATGTILASSHTQADYQTGAYYQTTGVSFNIHDSDGNVLDHEQKQTNGLTADASGQTDAYADQLYEINAGHYPDSTSWWT